ncbi:aldose epimerase family protein [Coraliomargarita parva]|uniref:aldose epimerase family protein n=1 Tax=Coraliomargarita parva TaxID=3014050 RepID=UPI0022B400BA|nr:aldose epimerase family protein [Coraliomargarita parva]
MSITSQEFGKLPTGESVSLFTLANSNGLSATVTNYGGIIVSLSVPDRDGKLEDILLGKDDFQGYLDGHPSFACITGRVAGRIGKGQFSLDGKDYQLAINNGPNSLHGGEVGFDKRLWAAEIVKIDGTERLKLSYTDPDGTNHYPGTVTCSVTYAMLEDNSLEITYTATTDKTTPFNITNHAYFNLLGQNKGKVLGHSVQIFADAVATVDEDSTLIGRRDPVVAGFNDYRQPVVLGDLKELVVGNADIHFFLDGGRTQEPKLAAIVKEPTTGRVMETLTTEPGVQFYAGLSLSDEEPEKGKGGVIYEPCDGLCLETQDYADSVNFPEMGGALLQPGEVFQSTTLYRFSTEG